MPALVPINSTSPLQLLLPQLLCFTVHHEDGNTEWVKDVQNIEKMAQLQALVVKLEESLAKSRKKNKELVERNEELRNHIVLATTENHELQDQLVRLHHNLTLRNHQLGEDVVLVQRNLSMRSVDLVRRLLRIERDYDLCKVRQIIFVIHRKYSPKVPERYEECLRVSSSMKEKPLPTPPSGRDWATS